MTIIGELFHLKHEDWIDQALCGPRSGHPVFADDFHPEQGRVDMAASAKTICRVCPVRPACLDYALARNEPHGVWGGYTVEERRNLKVGKPIDAHVRLKRRHCKRCSTQFQPKINPQVYCSSVCRRAEETDRIKANIPPRDCKRCGTQFRPNQGGTSYCSAACRKASELERRRIKRAGVA